MQHARSRLLDLCSVKIRLYAGKEHASLHGIALLDGKFDDLAGDIRADDHFDFGLHSAGGCDDLGNAAGFGLVRFDERPGIS